MIEPSAIAPIHETESMTEKSIRSALPSLLIAALVSGSMALPIASAAQETLESESQLLASAPARGSSAASLTFGMKIEDGRTETRGYSASGTWARSSMSGTVIRLDGNMTRGEYRPPAGASRITVDDAQSLTLSLVHPLKGPIALLGSGAWSRDVPVGLDRRPLVQGGIGFTVHRPNKVLWTVGPVFGFGNQDNAVSAGGDGIINFGGRQTLAWTVTPTFGIESSFSAYQNVDDSDDYSLDFSVSGTARVASRLGMKVSYSYTKEGIHPAAVGSTQTRLEFGATITLMGG